MKVQNLCLAVVAVCAVTAQSANAADWGYDRGIREVSPTPAVAVPAPVPVPTFKPSWYFRLDAGIGGVSQPDASIDGYRYGGLNSSNTLGYPDLTGSGGPTLQSVDPTWFSGDFSNLATFGAGVGYYLGGGWRMDGTIEKRSNDQLYLNGSDTWLSHTLDTSTTPASYTVDTPDNFVTMRMTDRTDIDGTVWLANMYYDFGGDRRGGFTPYIGAGLGFVWHQFDHSNTTTTSTCADDPCTGGSSVVSSSTSSTRADKVAFAAAAMAGFSYQISEITSVDVGYRYLYLGGSDVSLDIEGQPSKLSIGAQHIHQLRAGLRFDVN